MYGRIGKHPVQSGTTVLCDNIILPPPMHHLKRLGLFKLEIHFLHNSALVEQLLSCLLHNIIIRILDENPLQQIDSTGVFANLTSLQEL